MRTGSTVAAGVIGLVVGLVVGFGLEQARTGETIQALRRDVEAERSRTEDARADAERSAGAQTRRDSEIRDLQAKLRAEERKTVELDGRLAEAKAELDLARALAPGAREAAAPPAKKGPRFVFDRYAKLADVDWSEVGEHLVAIAPLCAELIESLRKGEPLDPETVGSVQKHNGSLVTAALKMQGILPGTGANGTYTHPAFQVNAIAAALAAAGMPLAADQATALERLAREFCDEDARRLLGYVPETYQLQKIADEADLRRRFYEAAFAVLTQEQRDTLVPPAVRGRLGFDLFSDGLVWAQFVRPVEFKDADSLATAAAGALVPGLKIPGEAHGAAAAVVAAWARDLPPSLLEVGRGGPLGAAGVPVEQVREAAARTLALVRRTVEELKLEGPSAEAARKWFAVLLPVRSQE